MDARIPDQELRQLLALFNKCSLRELVEALPLPTFIKTEEGVHIVCNEAYAAIWDRKPADIVGLRIGDFATPDVARNAAIQDESIRNAPEGEVLRYQTRTVLNDKRAACFEISKCMFSSSKGAMRWILGVATDISDSVRYQAEIESQHRFMRTVMDNLSQWIYAKDRDSRFIMANRATAMLMTGQPDPEVLIGRTDADFYGPDLWVKFYNDEQEVLRTGDPLVNLIERVDSAESGLRWSNTTKMPLRDESGDIVGIIGIGTDFTHFKATEEQLRLQATALEIAADGIMIIDRHGTTIWVNSAMCAITGCTQADMIGRHPSIFETGDHTESFFKGIWETVKMGQTWKGSIAIRNKAGELRTTEITSTPFSNDVGVVTHFVSICRDVSDREAMRQEMGRIHAAVSGARDGILLLSNDGRPAFVNRAFVHLLGYRVGEVPQAILDLIHLPNSRPDTIHDEGGDIASRPVDLPSQNGEIVPVEVRNWSVHGNGADYLGQVYLLRDLREDRRRAEQQKMMEVHLRQAQKMEAIGQLAAGIAHEINNPIQFVGNNTSFLESSFESIARLVEAQKRALEKAGAAADMTEVNAIAREIDYEYLQTEIPEAIRQSLDGVKRVSDIVKAMKDFSHPGTKHLQRADLNKAVRDAVLVARNEWKYNSDVEMDLAPELPPVMCMAGEVNQAILNVLVNAAHAINEAVLKGRRSRGHILLATRAGVDEVHILISDNGTGIPKHIHDRIFEPFFTTKEVGKGTGQGLAITYDTIVRKHGGRITFDTKEGEGTTFTIALPTDGKGGGK